MNKSDALSQKALLIIYIALPSTLLVALLMGALHCIRKRNRQRIAEKFQSDIEIQHNNKVNQERPTPPKLRLNTDVSLTRYDIQDVPLYDSPPRVQQVYDPRTRRTIYLG